MESVRGVLYPVSAAALRSVKLSPKKKCVLYERARIHTPEYDEPVSGNKASNLGVVLCQTSSLHTFDFGTSSDSFLQLRCLESQSQDDICYINIQHGALYPDPESADLWLLNQSLTKFHVKKLIGNSNHVLGSGERVKLSAGRWDLCLGRGLEFLLDVCTPSLGDSTSTQIGDLRKTSGSGSARSQRGHKPITRRTERPGSSDIPSTQYTQHLGPLQSSPRRKHADQSRQIRRGLSTDVIGTTLNSEVKRLQERDGTIVAVKTYRSSHVVDVVDAANMWRQEVKILSALKTHPNIVRMVSSDAIRREIKLSFVPGLSVDRYINDSMRSTCTDDQCREIVKGSAQALAWLQEQNILHNDIKPANTMYDAEQNRVVLIDFGIATFYSAKSFSGGGTPWYVAPEYLLEQRLFVSDIWALGVMMLFCLGIIQLPEKVQHSWNLGKVLYDFDADEYGKMKHWLGQISTLKTKILARHDYLLLMLDTNYNKRICARDLAHLLQNPCVQSNAPAYRMV